MGVAFHRVAFHKLADYGVSKSMTMDVDISNVGLESDFLQAFGQTRQGLGEVTQIEDVAFIEVRRERALGT